MLARRDDIRVDLEIERASTFPTDFPVFRPPERTAAALEAAVQRLGDPRQRLFDELTWFRFADSLDAAVAAQLTDGNFDRARALWETASAAHRESSLRFHYRHNLAVLRLYEAALPAGSKMPAVDRWTAALNAWSRLFSADTFWADVVSRSVASQDPRCPPSIATEIRDQLAGMIADTVRERAVWALSRDQVSDAVAWLSLLEGGQLPSSATRESIERVFGTVHELLRQRLAAVAPVLNDAEASRAQVAAAATSLDTARQAFDQLRAHAPSGSTATEASGDVLAETYRRLAMYYANTTKEATRALKAVEAALALAFSEGLRVRLRQDAVVLRHNVTFAKFQVALEARDYEQAKLALEALERDADEGEQQDLEPFRQALRAVRISQDCEPIEKAPGLSRINGIGPTILGRSGHDPETNTYLTTLFFTVLFVPVIAIRRYRVADAGNGRYHFFGKLALTGWQKVWNGIVATAVLVWTLSALSSGPSSTATSPRPARSVTAPSGFTSSPGTPVAPGPRNPAAASTGVRAVQRAEIERQRGELGAERRALDAEVLLLDALHAEIQGRRAQHPDGLPPDEFEKDRRSVAEFNERVRVYKARSQAADRAAAEFNASVDEYNKGLR